MTITLEVSPLKSNLLYNQLRRRKGFTSENFERIGEIPPWKVVQVEAFFYSEKHLLAVFPPSHEIDFALFKEMVGLPNLWRIHDHEYKSLLKTRRKLPIYTDTALKRSNEIILWTDEDNHGLSMSYEFLKTLVQPEEGVFSLPLL